jgi:hypothetical protein
MSQFLTSSMPMMSGFSFAISAWTAVICRFSAAAFGLGYRPGNHWMFQKTTVRLFGPVEGVGCAQTLGTSAEKAAIATEQTQIRRSGDK